MNTGFNYWQKIAPHLLRPIVAEAKPGALLCQEHIAARVSVLPKVP